MENITRYKCQLSGCPFVSTIESPVCEDHLEYIGRIYMETRSVAGTFMWLREELKRKQEVDIARIQVEAGNDPSKFAETVYYVRLGDHIKIGTTNDLAKRLRSLYADHDPDLLLAVEPGGYSVEQYRHAQFSDERVWSNRELFNPSRRLLDHIADLNTKFSARSVA